MTDLQLVQDEIPMGLNTEALDEWIEYRKEKGKPLSTLALKKSKNFLLKHEHDHQQHLVDTAIMNDWRGLYFVEMPKKRENITRNRTVWDDLTDRDWAK